MTGAKNPRPFRGWLPGLAVLGVVVAGCSGWAPPSSGPVAFDTAAVSIVSEGDTASLQVEVARTEEQQEQGLSGRSDLDPDAGMLFVFEPIRPDTAGFWMWGTPFPVDIAFMDEDGTIVEILEMAPCTAADPDDCPVYVPGVPHASALEVNRSWFESHGVGVGDRLLVTDDGEDSNGSLGEGGARNGGAGE